MKKHQWNLYKTLYVIPYNEFFQYLDSYKYLLIYKDLVLDVSKPRIQTHIHKSNVCICGRSTNRFAIQLGHNQVTPHVNAWSFDIDINRHFNRHLMTSNLIVSKALGGSDHIDNRRVLCLVCANKISRDL